VDVGNVHVSTIVTAAEVILQLCAERRRQRLVLLERRISAISTSFARPRSLVLEARFPERSECQMFCRLVFLSSGGEREDYSTHILY